MDDTKDNLASAFAGESQANRRYLAFAKKAKEDGYPNLAKLFKAAAAAETVHAHNHLRVMGGIGSTVENVEEAISGETHEFKEMYPGFIATAKKAGESQAVWSFDVALQVEKVHVPTGALADHGIDGDTYPRPALIGHYGESGGSPALHLHGHFDVVPAADPEQYHPVRKDGRI